MYFAGIALAEDPAITTLLSGLNRPCGIAARPGGTAVRYELLIAESGAGRVVRWANVLPDGVVDAITGFATAAAASPSDETGPAGLLFIDRDLLVVSAASDRRGDSLVVFELADEGKVLAADDAIDRLRSSAPLEPSGGAIACYSLTRSRANDFVPDLLIAAIGGVGRRAGLSKSRIQAGVFGPLGPFWSDQRTDAVSRSLVVSTSNTGRIVAAQTVASGDASAGRLMFLSPIDGSVEMEMRLDVAAVAGLAYSPTTGCLYAAAYGTATADGGIYRIDDDGQRGEPACRAVKIADVPHPTALAFAPDGALYVTTFGDSNGTGTLTVLTGDL